MKRILLTLLPVLAVIGLFTMTDPVGAVNVIGDSCTGGTVRTDGVCRANNENIENDGFITNLVNVLLFILGVIAVIAIIIGGIRYTTANGDASQIKSAKDTIMYSVVGLIVAIMAWGIVSFVVSQF